RLPPSSRVRVIHAGGALDAGWAEAARAEEWANPRYRWLGELAPARARRLIARARLLALTSRLEGGANVLGEALVCRAPVVASRIAGTEGFLGRDYPGLFRVGSTSALASLLDRAERDPQFVAELERRCRALRPVFAPARERAAWRALLAELA